MTNVEKEIKKRNKAFKGATNAQKRVLVAKDVIKQIKLGKLKPLSMTYFKSYVSATTGSLQKDFLNDEQAQCNACAVGSLFLSCTLFNNQIKTNDSHDLSYYSTKKFENELTNIFPPKMLLKIEASFEGWLEKPKFFDFNDKKDEEKLILIMRNIIKNKGMFLPSQLV